MPRKRKGRIYLKDGRYYGDFRDIGGKCEALKPPGERFAATDADVAMVLAGERVKQLESLRRGNQILGRNDVPTLGVFAQHHLEMKVKLREATDWTLGGVERCLNRAIEYFGSNRSLTAISVLDVQNWSVWLRDHHAGRRGSESLSSGSVRHHLNALSNLFRRAAAEGKVMPGFNPVQAWTKKPTGEPADARWLEIHEAALLLQASRLYERPTTTVGQRELADSDVAIGDLHAVIATYLLTGGRSAEVLGLEVNDVDFDQKRIIIRPNEWRRLKTKKAKRYVPLWPQLETILQAYLAGPHAPKGRLLFPSLHRRLRGRGEEMLGDLRHALDDVAERAGFRRGEIRCTMFRHTYASARLQTVDNDKPIAHWTVANELGHSSVAMIEKVREDHQDWRRSGAWRRTLLGCARHGGYDPCEVCIRVPPRHSAVHAECAYGVIQSLPRAPCGRAADGGLYASRSREGAPHAAVQVVPNGERRAAGGRDRTE